MKNTPITCKLRRTAAIAVATAILASLPACGGGGGSNGSTDVGSSAAAESPVSAPTNSSFFDSIFSDATGSGFYEFGANWSPDHLNPVAFGRTRFYVTGENDANFSFTISAISGSFSAFATQVYFTPDGTFTSNNPQPTMIGSNTRIYQRTAQGFQLTVNGMSGPLYDVTLTPKDVSGNAAGAVVAVDEAGGNGLVSLLSGDPTPMPAGSTTYRQTARALVPLVTFSTSNAQVYGQTLEQLASLVGGPIQTLGGLRYVRSGSSAYAEYNGAVYYATAYDAGDVDDAMPTGYNTTAANFLAGREQAVAGH